MTLIKKIIQHKSWPSLLVGIFISALYLFFFALRADVEIQVRMGSPGTHWFTVYWADQDQAYTESKSHRFRINGSQRVYQFFIGNLGTIDRIRFDPVPFKTEMLIEHIGVTQPGFAEIQLNTENGFAGLEAINHIENMEVHEGGLEFDNTGHDPQLEFQIKQSLFTHIPVNHLVAVIGILLGTLVVGRVVGGLQANLAYVPAMLLVTVALAFTMAVVSKQYIQGSNGVRLFVHPDEDAHVSAVEHFSDHWLPPRLDDPAIAHSFSIYGYTRLASMELYYPITGYLSRLLETFRQPFIINSRLVGVLLFALVALFAFRLESFRPFAAPFLITPQVWYLFSYSNSDGFAILLSTVAAYQLAVKQSTFNRLMTMDSPRWMWLHSLWLGLLAGSLLLLKLNFYFFVMFLGLYLIWRTLSGDIGDKSELRRFWTRVVLIAVIGVATYGGRYAVDHAVNGPDSGAIAKQMVEQYSEPLYKPSTELHRKHLYLYMRDRGMSLDHVLLGERWAGKTLVSAVGAYGYTQFVGSQLYYDLMQILCLLLAGVMLFSILVYGPASIHWLFVITVFCGISLWAASLWQSWTISFQPQGRYLAPVLPMLGVLYYHLRPWIMSRTFNVLVAAIFAVGVYSFIFIGLGSIPKIP